VLLGYDSLCGKESAITCKAVNQKKKALLSKNKRRNERKPIKKMGGSQKLWPWKDCWSVCIR